MKKCNLKREMLRVKRTAEGELKGNVMEVLCEKEQVGNTSTYKGKIKQCTQRE